MKASVPLYKDDSSLYGIGGWLLLFCLQLTVLAPLVSVGELLSMATETDPVLLVLGLVFGLGPVAYGIVVGVMLWQLRPSAVRHVRIYLIVFLCTSLLAAVASTIGVGLSSGGIILFLRAIAPFIVWWIYFKRSIRVKNTFGPERGQQPAGETESPEVNESDSD